MAFAGIAGFNPDFAKAEGFALQDWSARGAALAGGVVARGGDAAAVAYNPAAITELEGTQVMIGGELISLTNTIVGKNAGQKSESESKLYVSPHGYITHKLNDKFSLGFGLYSRYGLGNDHGSWFGSDHMRSIELLTLSATPVLAYQVTDQLSLAVGLEVMGGLVEYNKSVASGIGNTRLEGDAVNFGYNLSAHYRFNDQWKAGFVYRSHVTIDFEGDLTVSGLSGIGMGALEGKYSGEAKLYTPDSYTFALAYYPTDALSFEGQVQYNTWSRYNALTINTSHPAMPQMLEVKEWNDTWLFSLSAEYDWNEWLTLRAGASYETSPVDEKHADYIAPVNGRWKYAAGFGVHKDRWSVDVSYVFHDITDLYYDKSDLAAQASRTEDVYAHTVGLSFGYKF